MLKGSFNWEKLKDAVRQDAKMRTKRKDKGGAVTRTTTWEPQHPVKDKGVEVETAPQILRDMIGRRRRMPIIQSIRKAKKRSHLDDTRKTPAFRKRIKVAGGEECKA